MKVRDAMRDNIQTIEDTASVVYAISMIVRGGVGYLPVVDKKGRLVGMLSDTQLHSVGIALNAQPEKTKDFFVPQEMMVKSVMSTQVETVGPNDDLRVAVERMSEHRLGALPVIERKRLVGLVTTQDMLRVLRQLLEIQA